MSKCKKFLCFAFPVALVMSLVMALAFMRVGGGENANAASSIYVGSGGTCTISGGTISDDIDVAGGTLTLTGGTIKGNINLNGTLNLSSGATINGTVNLQNTNSYITLTSSLTKTISVKASSTAAGTKIAYSASASYLNTSRFSVTNLPSNMRIVVEGNYIVIRPNTFTVTVRAGSGGTVNSTSSVTISNVASGTAITESSNTLKVGGTTITATANSGYTFSRWSYSSSIVTSDMTIYAYFSETSCTVRFSVGSGGSVSRSSITGVPNGTPIYESGNTITINGTTVTAMAGSGYRFSRWSYYGTTVTSSMTITAEFEWVGGTGSGGSASSDLAVGIEEGMTLQPYDLATIMCFDHILNKDGSLEDITEELFMQFLQEAKQLKADIESSYYIGYFTDYIVSQWGTENNIYIQYLDFTQGDYLFTDEYDLIFSLGYITIGNDGYGDRTIGSLHDIIYQDGKEDIHYEEFAETLGGTLDLLLTTYNVSDLLVFVPGEVYSMDDLMGSDFALIAEPQSPDKRFNYIYDYLTENGCGVDFQVMPDYDMASLAMICENAWASYGYPSFIVSEALINGIGVTNFSAIINNHSDETFYVYYLSDLVRKSSFTDMCVDISYAYNFVYVNPGICDKFGREDISFQEMIETLSFVYNQRYWFNEELSGEGFNIGQT